MIDYETLKAEGVKYGLLNITPEEYERNKQFSILTALTRVKNNRVDTAKRIKKLAQIEKERKQQPEPEVLSMPVRVGPEPCMLHNRLIKKCNAQGFSCDSQCWARILGAVLCVEGITVEAGVERHKPDKPPQSELFGW